MILSIVLFLLAVICYSIKELKSFGKLKWMKDDDSFWGEKSWFRKYKLDGRGHPIVITTTPNWYYKAFNIDFKERFPCSATILVFTTDGAHFMQWAFKLLFCGAFYPLTNWWFPVVMWLLWTIVWNLCDKYLTK